MKNFNYRIAEYFLNNNRLTILTLGLLIVLGVSTTVLLKTTGFPEPEIKLALIQTIYPGASAATVAKDISQPLEGAIKGIAGVETYQSTNRNSVSIIRVDITDSANADTVRSKIASAVGGVELPSGAETPEIISPEVNGPSLIISIAGENLAEVYNLSEQFRSDLAEIPGTASVEPTTELERRLVITADQTKLAQTGITLTAIQQQLNSFNETIPVVSDSLIDDTNQSIQTALHGVSVADVEALSLSTQTGELIKLSEVATVDIDYSFVDANTPYIAVRATNGTVTTLPAVTLLLKAAQTANLGEYTDTVSQLMASYDAATYVEPGQEPSDTSKPWILRQYTAQEFNDRQVNEVVSGLIGGDLDIEGPSAKLGWLLGGIQLVVLVMIAFVSWRAALVAAAAIPLSLLFSTIYLYATGNDLNTLVLFSLVLVIGLVVDPALVILESIQRKIDIGLRGKAAALAAIEDVGMGLFLATLTNVIVFLPFGVISGLLGAIFAHIPYTIIPATIGSYIVPLIFLAWLGGLILRPSKKQTSTSEEANLWAIARWLIRTNQRILRSAVWVRCLIIIVALALPLGVTAWYFNSGQMKVVQFASSTNADYLLLEGRYFADMPLAERSELLRQTIEAIAQNTGVQRVFPSGQGEQYFVALQPAKQRGDYFSDEITADSVAALAELQPKFFDLALRVNSVGPPQARFAVALALSGADSSTRETAAKAIGETLRQVCLTEDGVFVQVNCPTTDLMVVNVDDGYTGQTNHVIEVVLDRAALNRYQLLIPNTPLSLLVNQIIRQVFPNAQTDTTMTVDGSAAVVRLQLNADQPATITELQNLTVAALPTGQRLTLDDIADIKQITAESSIIRVKGQSINLVQAALADEHNDQTTASQVTQAVLDYYQNNSGERLTALGLTTADLTAYSEGSTASNNKSFQELFIALGLALVLTYIVLAIFFSSFTQPLVILFTVPLSFLGIFPALAHLGNGQFGFLEIIGLIILVGIVENVAIFLIDAARQQVKAGQDDITAISYASGVRLRPVLMTKFTALASLAPLAFLSETYRSISLVIIFGLLTSGFTSLITTPILYVFFRWLSRQFHQTKWWNKILFFPLAPIYVLVWALRKKS